MLSSACGRIALRHLLCTLLLATSGASQQCGLVSENETDSGGDPCSYYGQHPYFCGCCDTPSFSASDCCECQEPQRDGNATWWASIFEIWPRKANALPFRKKLRGAAVVIPPNIAERLPFLVEIHLGGNNLAGGLPPQLGDLPRLTHLDLQGNDLSGRIPPELGRLAALQVLHLQKNQLNGHVPPELGSLTALRELRLEFNQLSGQLPAELGSLTALQEVRLYSNQLSGHLPPELGRLSALQKMWLGGNQLSGNLPPKLGNLSALRELSLGSNELSGTLPPELGNLTSLERLSLSYNQLSGGLPPSLAGLKRLKVLQLQENPGLCGDAAVLEELGSLEELWFSGCCFREEHLPGLPPRLKRARLSGNRLSRIPERWQAQGQSLLLLHLDNNSISQWDTSAIVPLDWASRCGYRPTGQPLAWQLLQELDVSSNPLSMAVYDFLESLGHLGQLSRLKAQDANLTGPVPNLAFPHFVPSFPHRGNANCSDIPDARVTFPALKRLDLSGNGITSLLAQPPDALEEADLSRNNITALEAGWWNGLLQTLDVRENPELRSLGLVDLANDPAVVKLDPSSWCAGLTNVKVLWANPHQWSATADGRAECTTLCPRQTQFLVDVSLNSSVLCRCLRGQGLGLDCAPCPDDTFSSGLSFRDGRYSRTCLECPLGSTLRGVHASAAQCFADCQCARGSYMAEVGENGSTKEVGTTPCSRLPLQGRCLSCGLFKSSLPGSGMAADCFCNSNESDGRGWRGLLERQGQCGCPEGSHMNFADRSCQLCQMEEDCVDWARSLEPPRVKPGYWALPPPNGSDGLFGNFSRHSIWRCLSTMACPGGHVCGENRTGRACSLCKRGRFGTPTGNCAPCPLPYPEARRLLASVLLPCLIIPVAVHFQLKSRTGEERELPLQSVLVSLKQLLQFMQVLGMVSLFRVEWPPEAAAIFAGTRAFFLDVTSWAGAACLDSQQQQTMTLELTFRWMLPLAGMVLTCLAALLVNLCGLVLGFVCARFRPESKGRVRHVLSFGWMDVLHVMVFLLGLLFPSLLKNALLPLSCAPSPNGLMTMTSFPHAKCWTRGGESDEDDESFWPVALAGLAQTVVLSIGFPSLLFVAWRRMENGMEVATKRQSVVERRKRWWAFLFADFRDHQKHWALLLVCKDIVLNLIVVLLPGFGTAQLLLTAAVSIAHACRAFCDTPYPDISNGLLETCTAAGVAAVCVFSAGMGFQSEPDRGDVGASLAAGRDGPGYLHRTIGLVSIQILTLVGPVTIVLFQLLVAFPQSRRCVPMKLQPLSKEQREEWAELFAKKMRINGGPLLRAVVEFDAADFFAFQQAVTRAPVARTSLSMKTLSMSKTQSSAGKAQEKEQETEEEEDESAMDTAEAALRTENAALRKQTAALQEEMTALKVDVRKREEAHQEEIQQLRRQARLVMSL